MEESKRPLFKKKRRKSFCATGPAALRQRGLDGAPEARF
jgi:hypothetical protein